MTVNDDPAKIDSTFQELASNPQQVLDTLTLQRDARSDAGMAKKIFSDHDERLQRRQESEVLGWYCGLELLMPLVRSFRPSSRR